MNPTNGQELRTPYELARYIVDFEFHSPKARYKSAIELTAHYEQLITAHTNAEIARTLDRLEKECHSIAMFPDGTGDYEVVPLSTVQDERAKLKEVK